MDGVVKSGISLAIAAALLVTCIGCARTVPMKVRPLGFLETRDYQQLESVANQNPASVGKSVGSVCEPTLIYYVSSGYDFSKARSIYIPDFRSTDRRAGDIITKGTAENLRTLLLKSNLFDRVEGVNASGDDMELYGDIGKYQEVTGSETAKAVLTGGIRCGICEMELKIVDSRTGKTIGAIKINYLSTRTGPFMGGILGWSGSASPASQLPNLIAAVLEKVKTGITEWSSQTAYTCTKDDGTSLVDKMCGQ